MLAPFMLKWRSHSPWAPLSDRKGLFSNKKTILAWRKAERLYCKWSHEIHKGGDAPQKEENSRIFLQNCRPCTNQTFSLQNSWGMGLVLVPSCCLSLFASRSFQMAVDSTEFRRHSEKTAVSKVASEICLGMCSMHLMRKFKLLSIIFCLH